MVGGITTKDTATTFRPMQKLRGMREDHATPSTLNLQASMTNES